MKQCMGQFRKNKKKIIPIILILLTTIVLVFPLLGDNVSSGHDYDFHVTNFLFNQSKIDILKLKFGISKIFGGDIARTFGYGTGIFYPPLSYHLTTYIANFLQVIKVNSILSISILQIIIVILSALTMYKFVKRISEDEYVSTISAISYISSIYYINNIYVRTAVAESLTFIFIPLVFWGLYELFMGDEKKFNSLFIIGYVGLINSHLVLSVYITIFILIVFLFSLKKVLKKEKIKKLAIASVLILLISSPFLIPLLEHKFYGNYAVFNSETMYTLESIKTNALSIMDFFVIRNKTSNGVEVYINYIVIYMAAGSIIYKKKIFKNKEKNIIKTIIIILLLATIISTKYFPWSIMPSFIKMIQFPWRMMGIIGFSLAILSGYYTKLINNKNKKKIVIVLGIFLILFGFSTIPKERITKPYFPTEISMGVQNEYLPQKTIENINYFKIRNKDIIIKKGMAEIDIIKNETPYLKSKIIINEGNKITIELPRLYYLGYSIKLDTEKEIKKIQYYENENGFIEIEIEESGILEVEYEGTKANKISNIVSILILILSICTLIYQKIKKNKKIV